MKRGCTQCGECLNVCPVYTLYKREEYSPKGKRLLIEPLDGWGNEKDPMEWEQVRELARLCAGCGRCQKACARKLSTCDLLADIRAKNPHWTQAFWDIWIRKTGFLWPLAGRIAMLVPTTLTPKALLTSHETARALVALPACNPWFHLQAKEKVDQKVMLFAGCTAKNVRSAWIDKAERLLQAWGYQIVDSKDFTCCGGTLHHAGQYASEEALRTNNIDVWKKAGKPLIATFCASCAHSLRHYAESFLTNTPEGEATKKQWQESIQGLSALLTNPDIQTSKEAPSNVGYHQPCHWDNADPDLPLLKASLQSLQQGTGLCCGMGGILKMSNPQLSADMAQNCLQNFKETTQHVLTGCSGCTMQLASFAPNTMEVRHWLDVVEVSM